MSKFVSKLKGKYPLVISVPHGGNLRPHFIPDRLKGVMGLDRRTKLAAKIIKRELSNINLDPYVVMLNVSRDKVDVNRPKSCGCESLGAEKIWDEYHNDLQLYINECRAKFGNCFIVDLHGQNHNRHIELGYCLKEDQLMSLLEKHTALRCSLIHSGGLKDEEDLIFGKKSFGYFLKKNGYPASPSYKRVPKLGEKYFSGAYNTKHFDFESKVRGFQLELNYIHIRDSYLSLRRFSKAFARALSEYLEETEY